MTFTIDFEKLEELNGNKTEAFFDYLKNVSKNKTPIVLQGCKKEDYWDCQVVECAVPVSIFYNIKLPAIDDVCEEGTKLTIQLTADIIGQFADKTKFTIKDENLEIKREGTKVNSKLVSTPEALSSQVQIYMDLLSQTSEVSVDFTVTPGSEIVKVLTELKASPEAGIFVTPETVTLLKDTVFFRTKNTENVAKMQNEFYINMYLANTILRALEYSASVRVVVDESHTIIIGCGEDGEAYTKSVSVIFDAVGQNPSEEDLAGIRPTENVVSIETDLTKFIEGLESQKATINTFVEARVLEAKLFKNGNGISFMFTNRVKTSVKCGSTVVANVGEISNSEVGPESFTEYSTVIPLEMLKNMFAGSLNLVITYNADDYSAISFKVGDSEIFSGKLF